ncbi:MAG: isopentenyl-diphosphate Delta-isomerase [Sphingobacteriales bacterium]|nr:MAG: isopentenyl-diphosphate Delta-isomerase [Sphingobacteriales bacterium]
MSDNVVLVDLEDNVIGTMQKMEAHVKGKLHRAFSVFIFNTKGELLLQQRALGKYHSGGKWTNTCCSHPRLGEDTLEAANRRLDEEMAMTCELKHVFSFVYCADMPEGISENEYDHVFFGVSDQLPYPDPEEVEGYRYVDMNVLKTEIESNPDDYTAWLKICFERVMDSYNKYCFTL